MNSNTSTDDPVPSGSSSEGHFWLPSATKNNPDFQVPEEFRTLDPAVARCATPEDSNLQVDDDTPLCSVRFT